MGPCLTFTLDMEITIIIITAPGNGFHQLMMWNGVEVPFEVGIDYNS
jgi:hypothetical protein